MADEQPAPPFDLASIGWLGVGERSKGKTMSEFLPVATLADLKNLDEDEILDGYREGLTCDAEPGSDKSRGYWHGWRNAQMDRGRMQHDASSSRLVREYLGSGVSGH